MKKKGAQKKCQTCKELYRRHRSFSRIQWAESRFCSQFCYMESPQGIAHHNRTLEAAWFARRGSSHSKGTKSRISESRRGKCIGAANPKWKGGTITPFGYRAIRDGGKQRHEHRVVMERKLGRALLANEDVHHIDGNKLHNRIDNLEVMTKSEHTRLHFLQDPEKFRMRYAR